MESLRNGYTRLTLETVSCQMPETCSTFSTEGRRRSSGEPLTDEDGSEDSEFMEKDAG